MTPHDTRFPGLSNDFKRMNTSKNEAIRQRDLAVLWHPTTQMKDHEWLQLLPVSSGKGVWLADLRALCDEYQVHLIADEIAVGFGRTGSMFACEQGGISPDFMCLSKGLTGGYLPMSAVLTSNKVYAAFYESVRIRHGPGRAASPDRQCCLLHASLRD
jgi:adenosylmethionine-8-amino-7-oxononanoate aminotransferase